MKSITIIISLFIFWNNASSQNGHIEIEGAIILSDTQTNSPTDGMIRWNTAVKDFEGYNGTEWVSLTITSPVDPKYNQQAVYNDEMNTLDQRIGTAVALEGDYAFVGAPNAVTTIYQGLTGYDKRGVVHVYKFDGYSWDYHSKLAPETIDQRDGFGASIAVFGNRLAIGCVRLSHLGVPITNGSNAVYIYELEQDQWIQKHEILDPDGDQQDGFGMDIDLFKEFVLVGTPYRDINTETDAGCSYVFQYDMDQDEWLQYGTRLLSNGPKTDDHFGLSVAIDEKTIVIGAPGRDIGDNLNQGQVFSFSIQINNEFGIDQTLSLPDGAGPDNFGYSLEKQDKTLVVGSIGRNVNGKAFAGSVAIFTLNNSGYWNFQDEIIKPNYSALDLFGFSISLTNDLLLIGSIGSTPIGNTANLGSALLYGDVNGRWSFLEEYYDNEALSDSYTGAAVAIGPHHLLVGSPHAFAKNDFQRPGKAFFHRHYH